MAKAIDKPAEVEPEENSKEVVLERLDAIGGAITLPNKAAAERLLKLEAEIGCKNYDYPQNGDSK